jgi:thioredoxin reductase
MTLLDLAPPRARDAALDALPVAIVGAGPVGLAAAAQLTARGIDFVVFEAGDAIASSMRSWGHVRLFSPWRHLIDPAARELLLAAGWTEPRSLDAVPSGTELIDVYLAPLAALPEIASRVRLRAEVVAVTRKGMDRTRTAGRSGTPFQLRVRTVDGMLDLDARAVIDASGTYRNPNPLASNGLEPLGLVTAGDRITHALPDVLRAERRRFAGKHVTVVGAGHSAANTLIALGTLIGTEPDTRVTWVIRHDRAARVFTASTDELTDRASLGAKLQRLTDAGVIEVVDSFEIDDVRDAEGRVALVGRRRGQQHRILTDIVVNATGFRPDLTPLREIRLDLDDIVESPRRLAPLIDPNVHSCGTVEPHGFAELRHPESDFFVAGMKSYGRAPTFLLATGYEQIRSIVAYLDGDLAAATDVRLTLPATGVCSTDSTEGCC